MNQFVGMYTDPLTGLVCVFKEEMLSFMYPIHPADNLTFCDHREILLPGKNTSHKFVCFIFIASGNVHE